MPFTYRDLIRSYSANVANGASDGDLNPRERRLTSLLLNLASNDDRAACDYPPSGVVRDAVVRHLSDVLWDAGAVALLTAVSPSSVTSDAYSAALERAITILRNL